MGFSSTTNQYIIRLIIHMKPYESIHHYQYDQSIDIIHYYPHYQPDHVHMCPPSPLRKSPEGIKVQRCQVTDGLASNDISSWARAWKLESYEERREGKWLVMICWCYGDIITYIPCNINIMFTSISCKYNDTYVFDVVDIYITWYVFIHMSI